MTEFKQECFISIVYIGIALGGPTPAAYLILAAAYGVSAILCLRHPNRAATVEIGEESNADEEPE